MEFQFRPMRHDAAALDAYAALFAACFPNATHLTPSYLNWLYVQNPEGRAIGFDAYHRDELAAHYSVIPARFRVGARIHSCGVSVNTATDVRYQRKGLFTDLAELTYEIAGQQGLDFVYGVANGNSTHGFLQKLGFCLIGPLDARIGVRSLQGRDMQLATQHRHWTKSTLAWRTANPVNPISMRSSPDEVHLYARTGYTGIHAHTALPAGRLDSVPPISLIDGPAPLKLFVGMIPKAPWTSRLYVPIPVPLRPSPLNLVFRGLARGIPTLDASQLHLSFIDFDAY